MAIGPIPPIFMFKLGMAGVSDGPRLVLRERDELWVCRLRCDSE